MVVLFTLFFRKNISHPPQLVWQTLGSIQMLPLFMPGDLVSNKLAAVAVAVKHSEDCFSLHRNLRDELVLTH